MCCILYLKRVWSNWSGTSSLVYDNGFYHNLQNVKTAPRLDENGLSHYPKGNSGQQKPARWTLIYVEPHVGVESFTARKADGRQSVEGSNLHEATASF